MLQVILSELSDVIAPFLDVDSVLVLSKSCKWMRANRDELLKRIVYAHVGPCQNWRAVGARYFSPACVPRFSMRNSLSLVVMCDFRAFLWCEVEQCVEGGLELSPLSVYLKNGLRRVRGDSFNCYSTKAGREHLLKESTNRPAQYPSKDAKLVVDAIASDAAFHARNSFVIHSDNSVGVVFTTSPAMAAVLSEIGLRVPRWCGLLIAAIQKSVPAHLRGFYENSLELE